MLALVNPNESVQYISGWLNNRPVFEVLPNSQQICQVVVDGQEFPVALPLVWVPCTDEVSAYYWYFDAANSQFLPVPDIPPVPEVTQLEQL